MAIFSFNGIEGEIKRTGYGLYQITAENEHGDTIELTTHDSELYDIINSETEDLDKRDAAIQALCKSLVEEDENCWQRKATVKLYATNATLFAGDNSWNIEFDFSDPNFFDSEDELKDWIEERINDLLWDAGDIRLLNYNEIIRDFCIHLNKYVK